MSRGKKKGTKRPSPLDTRKILMSTIGLGEPSRVFEATYEQYYGETGSTLRLKAVSDECSRQLEFASDHGCAILSVALLEQLLKRLLRKSFSSDAAAELLLEPSNGALGGFTACVHLAFATNLVSQEAYSELRTLAKIRNEFAHEFANLRFTDIPLVKDLRLRSEEFPERTFSDGSPRPSISTPRSHFLQSYYVCLNQLILAIHHVQPRAQLSIDPFALLKVDPNSLHADLVYGLGTNIPLADDNIEIDSE